MESWRPLDAGSFGQQGYRDSYASATKAVERKRRAAQEKMEKAREMVHAFEEKLNVDIRWTPAHPRWIDAEQSITEDVYRKAVDDLVRLVVARLFELSKLNHGSIGKWSISFQVFELKASCKDTKGGRQ